jgi:uncharacterized membrane protein
MKKKAWLIYALVTTVFWGVWGAFSELPTRHGFPDTLVYVVWSLTMLPPLVYALRVVKWRVPLDARSMFLGSMIGFTGAGGQMLLFHAVHIGPTYLIFPVIALSPVVTIGLSALILRERASRVGWAGIALALLALPLFDYDPGGSFGGHGIAWFVCALVIMVAWGVQAYYIKLANRTMQAEHIYFYMTVTGLLLAPVAIWMTDFSQPINYGLNGPWLAAATQILNAVGVLTLVHAFRNGKALVVSPLVNAVAPLFTALISMAWQGVVPPPLKMVALALAFLSALLLAIEPEEQH